MTKKKRTREEIRSERNNARRTRRIKQILTSLELWEYLQHTSLKQQLLAAHYPQPDVALGKEETPTKETKTILHELQETLKTTTFSCPLLGNDTSASEYFSTLLPVLTLLKFASSTQKSFRQFLKESLERIAPLLREETFLSAYRALYQSLEDVLIRHGRIDQGLYFLKYEGVTNSRNKYVVKFTFHCVAPQRRAIVMMNGTRPAFRCGQPFGIHGIQWIEWPASVFGVSGTGRYPVFVQSHALDNLYRREARALFIKDGEW